MSAPQPVGYTLRYERQTPTGRVGTSPPARRPTDPRGVLHRGGRRVSRRGRAAPDLPRLPGTAAQIDAEPREDRPPVADRQPDRARVRYRVVDRPAAHPADRGGVRRRPESEIPQCLAAGAGIHPAEAPARPTRARPEGDRRVAGVRLAAHQTKSAAARGLHRPDRRERPDDGPDAPPHLGTGGPDPGRPPARRPPPERLGRGGG